MSYPTHVGHRTNCEDIQNQIFQRHIAYLNQEETPGKLKQRQNLQNLILEFLSTVSHDEKFTFLETKTILDRSIQENQNFTAYKAALAFEALERYASNLLSHPWRREYKVIKLYSGFYKHLIKSQLIHGSDMFLLLGYKQDDLETLYLDEPVDPDRVAHIALDCLKAYTECQIMAQICEKVRGYKCTWEDILNVRLEYICGTEEAIRILQQLKKGSVDYSKQSDWLGGENGLFKDMPLDGPSGYQNHCKTDILVDISNNWSSNSSVPVSFSNSILIPHSISSYSTPSSKNTSLLHTKSISQNSSSVDNYKTPQKFDMASGHFSSLKSFANGKCTESLPSCESSVSQAFPCDYNISVNDNQQNKGAPAYVPNYKPFSTPPLYMYPSTHVMPMMYPCPVPQETSLPMAQFPYTMYCSQHMPVLPNVQHMSDLHTSNSSSKLSTRNSKNTIPLDANTMIYHSSLDRHSHVPRSEHHLSSLPMTSGTVVDTTILKHANTSKAQQQSNRQSFYDNVPSSTEMDESPCVPRQYSSEALLPKAVSQYGPLTIDSLTVTGQIKFQKVDDSSNSLCKNGPQSYNSSKLWNGGNISHISGDMPFSRTSRKDGIRWSCSSCTFYNKAEKIICDMCGRSKYPGPESTPLVSGGRECPQCTLVNKKDTENCTACGASLKDSPTYI